MIILQLDSEQLCNLIQNAVRTALGERNNNSQLETDKLLSIKEAAIFLHLSVPTIYALVSRLEIPVSKKGKRLYFSKQELNDLVKAGRKETVLEIQKEANSYLKKKAI